MDKEVGQWLAILGLIVVSGYALFQKEVTLAAVGLGALAGFLKQSSGQKEVMGEKTTADTATGA